MGIENVVWDMAGTYITDNAAMLQGILRTPSYIPSWLSASGDDMNFLSRLKNIIWAGLAYLAELSKNSLINKECELYQGAPDYDYPHCYLDLGKRVRGIFVNGEQMLDFPRPIPSTVAFLGSAVEETGKAKKQSTLDKKWLNLINQRDSAGTILMSFGSIFNTDHMPENIWNEMVAALAHFSNYTVIWKVTGKVPQAAKQHGNIHFTQWMPQEQLLDHPNTKLFITHAGYNSLLEASAAGVPLLMVPMFVDQYGNANRAMRLGLGFSIIYDDNFNAKEMIDKMSTLLDDPTVAVRGKKVSAMYQTRLVDSSQLLKHKVHLYSKRHLTAVYDTRHMKNLGSFKLFCLDVILFWSAVASISSYAIYRISSQILTHVFAIKK